MYRKLVLVLTLLSSAAWLQAQAGYPQSDASPMGQTAGTAGQATVEGCLQSSNGNYTLTADSGSVYQLTGDTSKLNEHVGHEVRITGTTSNSGAANSPSAMTPGGSQAAMLDVKSVSHISKTCKSSAK
jgi:hypothetical protein